MQISNKVPVCDAILLCGDSNNTRFWSFIYLSWLYFESAAISGVKMRLQNDRTLENLDWIYPFSHLQANLLGLLTVGNRI